MMSLIYLASPYSHPERMVRSGRYIQAAATAARLISEGMDVFCPISHSHPMCVYAGKPFDAQYWQRVDNAILAKCDEFWILMLDGWKESKGISAELAIAVERSMPVRYLEPFYDVAAA